MHCTRRSTLQTKASYRPVDKTTDLELATVRSTVRLGTDELAASVHVKWLENNPHAQGGPLGVTFEMLPPVEQAKDMSQVLTCGLVLAGEHATHATYAGHPARLFVAYNPGVTKM